MLLDVDERRGTFTVAMESSFVDNAGPYYNINNDSQHRQSKLDNNHSSKANGATDTVEAPRPGEHEQMSNNHIAVAEPKRRGRKRGSTNAASLDNSENRRRKRDSEVVVGERIRRLRLESGLSQEELGKASKMSTSYISRLETGEVNPTVDALTRIVRVFGLSIDGLLELNTEAPKMLDSDDLDPEIRVMLFKLRGKAISDRTKRIIRTVIDEELRELGESVANEN